MHARSLVDSFQPRAIADFIAKHPGFDFSHPVSMNDPGLGEPTKNFEPLAYRCIRMVAADEDAAADASWIASGLDTFKTLVDCGVNPGARNNQGLSALDMAAMLLRPNHRWRKIHKQPEALEVFTLGCLGHMIEVGMDIDAHTWTTPLARLLSDHSTPRKMLDVILGGPPGNTRSVIHAHLMKRDVDPSACESKPGPRF